GLLTFHRNFEETAKWDGTFTQTVPVPGDDAAGGEFHFDDGRTFAEIAFEDGKSGAVGDARNGGEFCGHAFAEDSGVGGFLGGRRQSREKQCGEKNRFHEWLRLVSGYVSRLGGGVSNGDRICSSRRRFR